MPDGDSTLFTVTDLKQFGYCPRILYYQTCLPDVRPVTLKMTLGIERHEDEQKRSLRRTMKLDGLETAQRQFDVPLQSTRLGLSGKLDELIQHNGDFIPVDYKLARKDSPHFRLQLAAYALLVEEQYSASVKYGLLYLIQARQTVRIPITSQLRQKVLEALNRMRQIVETESMPVPPESRRPCVDCEFRRFCNDVL